MEMNKEDLVKAIASKTQLTKENANKAFDALIQTITQSLKNGESVALAGFGSFKVTKRAERQGRNPRTGAAITIAAATVPSFTAAKALKDAVKS